jgi:predicted ATPase
MRNRLLKLELSGFKSIERLDLPLGTINVLIGANGSGKSNLIGFFRLLNSLCSNALQEFVALGGGGNSHLHFGARRTPQLQGTVTFSSDKGENRYHLRLAHGAGDKLVFLEESLSYCQAGRAWDTAPAYSLGVGHLESQLGRNTHDVMGKKLPHKLAATIGGLMRDWQVFQFHDTSRTARIKQAGYADDCRHLRDDAGNLAAFLLNLRDSARPHYDEIVRTIQRVLPAFKDFVLEAHPVARTVSLNWRHRGGGNDLFGPHQLSDGSLRLMALCTLLLQPRLPSLILLDEPELGLHPYAIELLAGLIRSVSSNCQFIFSTQSVTLANQFEAADVVVVDDVNDASTFRRLPVEELGGWLKDYKVGDLWVKNLLGGVPE